MEYWNEEDIGNVIVYLKKGNFNSDLKETIAICKVFPNSTSLGVVDYPIELSSRYHLISLYKEKKKCKERHLNHPGDWYLKNKASKEEAGVLEKLARE
jgi:hypothetical protein